MIFKVLLVLPAVLFVSSNSIGGRKITNTNNGDDDDEFEDDGNFGFVLIRGISIVLILTGAAIISFYSKPFIRDKDDKLDQFVTSIDVFLAFIGLLGAIFVNSSSDTGVTITSDILSISSVVLFVFTIVVFLSEFGVIQDKIKSLTQRIDLSINYEKESFAKVLSSEHGENSDAYDYFANKRKIELWHPFWDFIFENDHLYRIPAKAKYREKLEKEMENKSKQKQLKQQLIADDDAFSNRDRNIDIFTIDEKNKKNKAKYKPKLLEFDRSGFTPSVLVNFEGTVGERHAENKEIATRESVASFRENIVAFVQKVYGQGNLNRNLVKPAKFSIFSVSAWTTVLS